MLGVRAVLVLARVILGLSAVASTATASTEPGVGPPAPVSQEETPTNRALPDEAAQSARVEAHADMANGVQLPERPAAKTIEEVRIDMEEARKRRQALMQPDAAVADAAIHKELIEKWGVEVMGVRLAARGYMMDFRFRVLDLEKALPLFDSRIKPYVIPEGTDVKLPVPAGQKVGTFRTTNRGKNIQAGKDYVIMFANPDAFVKSGQKVSVVIGDFRVERLTLK